MRELEESLKLGRQPAEAIIMRVTGTATQDIADLRPELESRAMEIVAREAKGLEKIGEDEAQSLRALLERSRKRIVDKQKELAAKKNDI